MWVAGWNMPGSLPETQPLEHTNWEDAKDYICGTLHLWADQEDCEKDDDVPTETFMRAINVVRDLEENGNPSEDWYSHLTVSGYAFWITNKIVRPTDKELMHCRDCFVWDPDNQPSVQRQLERDPDAYADRLLVTVQNGMFFDTGAFQIPLSTDLLLCTQHQKRFEELN
jgi:hypothetical protein